MSDMIVIIHSSSEEKEEAVGHLVVVVQGPTHLMRAYQAKEQLL